MSLLSLFKKKDVDMRKFNGRERFSQDDIDASVATRKRNAELRRLQDEQALLIERMRTAELQAQYNKFTERIDRLSNVAQGNETADTILIKEFFDMVKQGKRQQIMTQPAPQQQSNEKTKVPNFIIEQLLDTIPKSELKKLAKKTDEELIELAEYQLPEADEDSIQRAISLLRARAHRENATNGSLKALP